MKWVCQRSPPRDSRQAPAGRVVPYSFGIFHLPSHLPAAASPPFPLNRAYSNSPIAIFAFVKNTKRGQTEPPAHPRQRRKRKNRPNHRLGRLLRRKSFICAEYSTKKNKCQHQRYT